MRARSTRWLGALTVLAGTVLAASALAAGCGGKTDEENPGTQPQPDTGVTIVDSAPDTGSAPDTSTSPDTGGSGGGSIFDAEMPDITFDGGTTAKGCYDCTITECKSQVEACDADDKCRTLFVCAFSSCLEDLSDFGCLASCAFSAGVTNPSDPAVQKALDIIECNQAECSAACPEIPDAGTGGDAASEAAVDATADAADGSSSSFMSAKPSFAKAESLDPKLMDALVKINTSISSPEARRSILDRMKR